MKPERAAAIMAGMLGTMAHWEDELRQIPVAPAGDTPKRHLLCSMQQARQSLRQLIQRDSGSESS